MTDIVEWLRHICIDERGDVEWLRHICIKAADEIESLRQQLAECQARENVRQDSVQPVGEFVEPEHELEAYRIEWFGDIPNVGTKLYTSTALDTMLVQARREGAREAFESVVRLNLSFRECELMSKELE